MAITNGYGTSAQFQLRTGLTNDQLSAKLSLIELEIENNSRIIDRVTGNIFYTKTLTDSKAVFSFGYNADSLFLSEDAKRLYFPGDIITLTEVKSNDEVLVLDTDYYKGTNFIEAAGTFTTGREYGVVVTGTCGYATTPNDVNAICLAMSEVTTGLGTYTMIDSAGGKVEVTRDNIPDWVFERLYARVRFDNYG